MNGLAEGYYLSTYLEIDPIGNVYLLSQRHDQCIALWRVNNNTVELMHYLELERLSGLKRNRYCLFNAQQYYDIVDDMLRKYGLTILDINETWGTPQLNDDLSYLSIHQYPEYTYHAMCHIASCLFMDMDLFHTESILAFSVDGGSDYILDKNAHARKPFICAYKNKNDKKINFSEVFSPGLIWSFMADYSGLQEGTLMALASATKSKCYLEFPDILINANDDEDCAYDELMNIVAEIEKITDNDVGIKFNGYDSRFSRRENNLSMIMKIVQKMSFNIMERNVDDIIKKFQINPHDTFLAMSGGYALNCPSNTHLMRKYNFKGFAAPPCVSDTGMALGCGLYTFYHRTNGDFKFKLHNAFYGDNDSYDVFVTENREFVDTFIENTSDFDANKVVEDIINAPIIWFDGRAEIGPRALGGRSLLADPRTTVSKDQLNNIKLRQNWRPVAPIIKSEEINNWFDESFDSPFMLHTFNINKDKSKDVFAIMHEDGSARVQTISNDGSKLRQVLDCFHEKTKIPMLCNTSLNDKGEPIINRIDEAINFALRKNIRICYINGKRLLIKNHEKFDEKSPKKRLVRIGNCQNEFERKELIHALNPFNLDDITMCFYIRFLINDIEALKDQLQAKILERRAKMHFNSLPQFKKDIMIKDINLYENFRI